MRNSMLALTSILLLVVLTDAAAGPPLSSLDLPLTIHEVGGVDRRQGCGWPGGQINTEGPGAHDRGSSAWQG